MQSGTVSEVLTAEQKAANSEAWRTVKPLSETEGGKQKAANSEASLTEAELLERADNWQGRGRGRRWMMKQRCLKYPLK